MVSQTPVSPKEARSTIRTIGSLAPLAAGLVAFGVLVGFLLTRNLELGYWLLAAFLIGHGLVHAVFLMPPRAEPVATTGLANPFDMSQSWLTTKAGVSAGTVRAFGVVLIGVVVVGFALAGLATVGVLVPTASLVPLVTAAAVASTLLLIVFLNPALVLGFIINAALLWLVLSPSGSLMARGATV
jgi:hypothetical protein